MRQRGRKSAELIAMGVDGRPPRLTVPSGLNAKECALAQELIDAAAPEHFRASDAPLLVALVQATLLSRNLARDATKGRDPAKVASWERATRTMASLATKLRLSPQSRTDPKTTGRETVSNIRAPWLREDGTPY